jgi:hypothetical protein
MAISWGAWSSNNRLRAGVEVVMSPSTITASTTKVTLTTKAYLQTRYASSEYTSSNTWYITGSGVTDGSGSTDWSLSAMGYKLMGTTTTTVTLTTSTQAKPASVRVKSNAAYPGTEATVSTTFTVPKLAVAAPAPPISLSTSRISDTSQKVSWSRQATSSAPYDSQIVYRKDNISTSLVAVATVTGTTTSWTDTKTRSDRVYTYAVRAKNTGGYSGYAYAPNISTTPAAPAAPTVKKTTSGDITVTRPTLSPVSTGGWEVWHAANGVWDASRLALVAYGTTSWTHVAPNSTQTHTYRLKAVSSTPTLYSANGATSVGVTPLTPPSAPTGLSPSGVAQEAAESALFVWTHNPLDTTDQSAYEIQWRPVATTTWTSTGKVTSTASSRLFAANTWTNGQTIEWQVRTWGQHATASAWSASGTLTLSTRPVATITGPTEATPWDSARVRLDWTYGDAEGQVQTAWKANLYAGDGSVLESLAGADSTTSVRFATRVADGGTYSVDVVVRDSTGLWSAADSVVFTVDFAVLPTPVVSAEFDVESAASSVYVTVPVPSGVEVPVDTAEVWRSIDGGPWALIADDIVPTPLPDRVNALANPSFETDTSGWITSGGLVVTRETSGGVQGPADVLLSGGSAQALFYNSTAATAAPNEAWTASFHVKGTAGQTVSIACVAYTSAGAAITGFAYVPFTLDGTWQRISNTLVMPATAAGARAILSIPVAGQQVRVDGAMLERSDSLGSYIEGTVKQPSTFAVTDAIPALNASNRYKAVVETAMGAFGESAPVEVFTSGVKHLFVNAGPGFGDFVRVNSNVNVDLNTGRSRALRRAAGRDLPVPFDGQQVTTEVSVSATLWRPDRAAERASQSSSWQDISRFALSYSPACFRDPDGNRVFVSMAPVRISGLGTGAVRSVSWSMSAIDYEEPVVSSTTL